MRPGFTKHYVEGLPVAAVFHTLSEPDTEGSIHDHPFSFTSFVISGGYVEKIWYKFEEGYRTSIVERKPGSSHRVEADTIHQILALPNGECHTLILPEAKTREPGFYKFENGKVYHRFHYEKEFRLIEETENV